MPLLMQFEIGMSINRYLPPTGTAGLLRIEVNGASRVPRPPPRISATAFDIIDFISLEFSFLNRSIGANDAAFVESIRSGRDERKTL